MTAGPCTNHEQQLRVLVVDDEEQSRLLASRLLAETSVDYATARDGQDAIDAMSSSSYDLVLLDLNMPRVTGLQVLDWIREHHPQPRPYILVTSVTRRPTRDLTDRGADAVVPKPLTRERLTAALAAARER